MGRPFSVSESAAPGRVSRRYRAVVMSDFVLRRWDLEDGSGNQAPLHVHNASDEAFVVVSGELDVQLGTERRRVAAGEHVHVPAGVAHTFAPAALGTVVVAIMTPEIDELVTELHQPAAAEEAAAVWARHRSRVV